MTGRLTRIREEKGQGTIGVLNFGSLYLWTVERNWLDNQPNISCVPPGFYFLRPFSGVKYQDTWALEGETVSMLPEAGVTRSTCALHIANRWSEVKGCIGPGLYAKGMSVLDSEKAMEALRQQLSTKVTHRLWIEEVLR